MPMVVKHWKDIPNYEGLYVASADGQIRGLQRGKILKPHFDRSGYPRVRLSKHGQFTRFLVHRIIAATFIGPCPKFHVVNHKNGIKTDRSVENLEYVTKSENERHAYQVLGIRKNQGSRHGMAKLTEEQVKEIRALPKPMRGEFSALAQKYRVSIPSISMIVNNKTWRHQLIPVR
jgi:hypothetical protein